MKETVSQIPHASKLRRETSRPIYASQKDGSNGDQPQNNTLGGGAPKQQDISSEIGRPPLKRRYRKKRRASGLCARTPSIPDIYK